MIRVVHVEPLDGYRLRVRFGNGEVREVNVERFLRGPDFDRGRARAAVFGRVTPNRSAASVTAPS